MAYSLQMVLLTETSQETSITVSEVQPDLTNTEVVSLMDTIIANNVFETKKGALVSKYSAQVVQRKVTKWDLK